MSDPDSTLHEQVLALLNNKSRELFKLRLYEQSIAVLDELLTRFDNPTDLAEPPLRHGVAWALYSKALTLDKLRRHQRAIDIYNEVIHRFGNDKQSKALRVCVFASRVRKQLLCMSLGNQELRSNHFKEAGEYFREAFQCGAKKLEIKQLIEKYLLEYYGCNEEENNPTNGNGLSPSIITQAKLRKYISEQAALLTERISQSEDLPFPILSGREVKAIIAHGKTSPWDDREKKGWPYHTNAFVYVHIIYRKWANRGLTREILMQADSSLGVQLNKKISREGLPGWLDLPTGAEARARAITDPIKRAELDVVRKFWRNKMRAYRS